jgi:hypothetical protein
MNTFLLATVLAVAAFYVLAPAPGVSDSPGPTAQPGESAQVRPDADAAIESAYASRLDNQQVEGAGTVVKLLADDSNGSRHQRFIVRLASGRTLLLSHNIDLAPRIDALRVGDRVTFYGEYEWNPKGGLIHWTHHDPQGRHPAGWIRHEGRTYQ